MPIYEYKCRQCGGRFERLVLSSSPPPECPTCKRRDLEQLVSMCGVSSESTRQANLMAARKKVGALRKEKQIEEHKGLHEHFEDRPGVNSGGPKP